MKILHVVGARPNFMKLAPVHAALTRLNTFKQVVIHTGQHYDIDLSDVFFKQLELPLPTVSLNVGSGSHAQQTAAIMSKIETEVITHKPDFVVLYGDINSTLAAALVCAKLNLPIAHVEAGLRSGDRTMPEEINRIITDQLSTLHFTTSSEAEENLLREGIAKSSIYFVGNVMIDTLMTLAPKAHPPEGITLDDRFALLTLHRPSNVDTPDNLHSILTTINKISKQIPVIFPVHPRTQARIDQLEFDFSDSVSLIGPVGYLECLSLQQQANFVITDSGGIQEETTALSTPCLTVRENTERPVTVTEGTNTLVGRDMKKLLKASQEIIAGRGKKGKIPEGWDGHAASRIAKILARLS